MVGFWLDRRPHAFRVCRRPGDGKPVAFVAWLRLTEPGEQENAADPLLAAIWAHAHENGSRLAVQRFVNSGGAAPEPGFAGDLLCSTATTVLLREPELAWSYLVMPDPESGRLFPHGRCDPLGPSSSASPATPPASRPSVRVGRHGDPPRLAGSRDTGEMAQPYRVGRLELVTEVSPAAWVVEGVRDRRRGEVGALVPAGFAAYARVFHPAWVEGPTGEKPVRWDTVAAANGRHAHPGMQWEAIAGTWIGADGRWREPEDLWEPRDGRDGTLWTTAPWPGVLPKTTALLLVDVLRAYTRTPHRCWFAVWAGHQTLVLPRDGVPHVGVPDRPMLLLTGPLDAATTRLDQPAGGHRRPSYARLPNMWWPDDRSWCVVTDADQNSTYLGCSRACIDSLLVHPRLEAREVDPGQRTSADSDEVNRPPRYAREHAPRWWRRFLR
ncbi:hypothetical protein [Actinoplanes teichomyceticus]|uniref:Uncharacterized protein n=1 Tax=Actinoplanes teichomyceticus TaxID=1867 RepID=A0A561WKC8_ACTTI|nr:hypothetical protein [Actinoplanes teichomyceticus]TWG24319.1 hypothetical protein FHX34_102872 [Actinoplanes teichomyceticus]GIF12831.1 hypothetical protein Ate01nite_28630 [Actinoplanes teichomyceticus]